MHAEIRVDDSVVMLGDASEEFPPIPSIVHVYVNDVDVVYARALEAGGESIERPHTRDGDPDKRGSVRDPCANTWAIATQRAG